MSKTLVRSERSAATGVATPGSTGGTVLSSGSAFFGADGAGMAARRPANATRPRAEIWARRTFFLARARWSDMRVPRSRISAPEGLRGSVGTDRPVLLVSRSWEGEVFPGEETRPGADAEGGAAAGVGDNLDESAGAGEDAVTGHLLGVNGPYGRGSGEHQLKGGGLFVRDSGRDGDRADIRLGEDCL